MSSLGLSLALAVGTVSSQQPALTSTSSRVTDSAQHRVAMVTVKGVQVPYLDWGGAGVALVFIPGMGHSAHVYDDFAPRFIDRFRVVGVTRVGFGESDQPERDGYDLASRVAHIRAALDELKVARALLVGHSLGGDEITAFAGAYPERTLGVIYLDAGLDHTVALKWVEGLADIIRAEPRPSAADRANAQAYREFYRRIRGIRLPIGEVLATLRTDAAGVVVGQRASQNVFAQTVAATAPPNFKKVQAPVLSLYSDDTPLGVLPWLRDAPALRARADTLLAKVEPEVETERARFAQDVKGAQIFTYPANHYQFLTEPDDTERRMRVFLSSLSTR
ncbi:MAG: alpha/beta hydrolase [Vicinamibacterales bacterium]